MIVFSYIAIALALVALLVALWACVVLWLNGLDAASRVLDTAWGILLVAATFLIAGWVT